MEQIKIDIVPVGVAPVAHASQFDNGRQIRFNLFNQGTPYTLTGAETVTMVVNGEEENITNTSDNYVIWDVAEEDCEKVGVIGCEIRIVLGSMLIGSKNFFLEVEMDPYNGKNIRIVTVGPADICTFETTLPEPYPSVTVNVLATGGNDTPDNPIPINGYTEANITRCGVNLWDEEIEEGRLNPLDGTEVSANDYYRSKNFIPCKSGVSYYAVTLNNPPTFVIVFYDKNQDYLGYLPTASARNQVFSIPNGVSFFRLYYTGGNYPISINYPSTDTTYHAYNGQTYAIAFGQTVYGGVLDVTRGKLSGTWNGVDLGDLNWTYRGPDFPNVFSTLDISDYKTPTLNALCSIYAYGGVVTGISDVTADKTFYFYYIPNSPSRYLYIKDTAYTDKNTFTTAVMGQKVAYELATPFDIDLTPVQIRALVGENNVFADCGQTTVEYMVEE